MRSISNLNLVKTQRKLDSLERRHYRKERDGFHPIYLEKIIMEIKRTKKLLGKLSYISKMILSNANEFGTKTAVGAVSYGPALKGINKKGDVVYKATFDPARNIRFI
jgi:hypothetical protein